ncbi:MAG TPA: hypothetical protein VGJ20_43425 [Xanthobacteraceae bacterium]|jgi:hypothetical protein
MTKAVITTVAVFLPVVLLISAWLWLRGYAYADDGMAAVLISAGTLSGRYSSSPGNGNGHDIRGKKPDTEIPHCP